MDTSRRNPVMQSRNAGTWSMRDTPGKGHTSSQAPDRRRFALIIARKAALSCPEQPDPRGATVGKLRDRPRLPRPWRASKFFHAVATLTGLFTVSAMTSLFEVSLALPAQQKAEWLDWSTKQFFPWPSWRVSYTVSPFADHAWMPPHQRSISSVHE